jgi:pimeloyl-ACP methyl ester carboxylesterase
MSEAFDCALPVSVAGGEMTVATAGAPVAGADGVVLALHGIAASHRAWASVARRVRAGSHAALLAPDLRGRGASAQLPGPHGIAQHVADMVDVLDHFGVDSAVVAGHSMGAYVAARLAAEHPERVSQLVLVDGGLPMPGAGEEDPDDALQTILGPSFARLGITFTRRADYLHLWRLHPAFSGPWDTDVLAYLTYDVASAGDPRQPEAVRPVIRPEAVHADGRELLVDEVTRTAVTRVPAPVRIVRAERGLLDDEEHPLLTLAQMDALAATRPDVAIDRVSDVNHYTVLLGPGPGARRVTRAILAALDES